MVVIRVIVCNVSVVVSSGGDGITVVVANTTITTITTITAMSNFMITCTTLLRLLIRL